MDRADAEALEQRATSAADWAEAAAAWDECAHNTQDACEKAEELLRAAECVAEEANCSGAAAQQALEAERGWYLTRAAKYLIECADQSFERGDFKKAVEIYHLSDLVSRSALGTRVARLANPWQGAWKGDPEPPMDTELAQISNRAKDGERIATDMNQDSEREREEKTLPR
jgi:hypothetical protein